MMVQEQSDFPLKSVVWNCDGNLHPDIGMFDEKFKDKNIAETHQCEGNHLLEVDGYKWGLSYDRSLSTTHFRGDQSLLMCSSTL